MENYDERRGHSNQNERYRARPGYEDRGGGRESWRGWSQEDQRPRRSERGWLDYDTSYGRRDEGQRGREEPRYGESREERPRFSPDWSREGEQPRYSDEPYYARNREQGRWDESSRRDRESEDRRRWDQRARGSVPREQYELAERGEPGDYYDPDWPYQRGASRDRGPGMERSGGREMERSGDNDPQRHYHGYYRSSAAPFSYPGGSGYLYSESWTLHGPHSGRGPKGYKRSDQQICEDACQRLERDGEIDASDIEVSAEDGIVHLRGTVPDRRTKRRAEECVESVYGARDVMNELRVQREPSSASQAGLGSQGSQATQASQSGRGSQQQAQGQNAPRTGGGSSASDQPAKH
jgi:hypothetical protein